jgi:hypothetical protein
MKMNSNSPDTLVYLYGIVPANAPPPPPDVLGLEGGEVRLLPAGRVAAVVSEVPRDRYDEDALNERLDDLAWVGEQGVAHERVLDWYAERVPIIPLSLFSLHRDAIRVADRVASDQEDYSRRLARLSGRKEWGVKVWRREGRAAETIHSLSPALQALGAEIEAAPAGKRFLLEKKRQTLRQEEVRAVSRRVAHEVHAELRARSVAGTAVPLPSGAPSGERALLLHAAYLVADDSFEEFRAAASDLVARFAPGFEVELTGPWPPYHFVEPDDE